MTENKMMGARVEKSWAEEIEAIAQGEGTTSAEICRRAFGEYLGKQAHCPGGTLQERVSNLERQLAKAQKWIEECEQWGNSLEERLTTRFGEGWG